MIQDPHAWVPRLRDAAHHHVRFDVSSEMYAAMGESLLFALEQRLGDRLSPAAAAAWSKAYNFIAAVMMSAHTATDARACTVM